MHDDRQTATGNFTRQLLTTAERTNHQRMAREQRSHSTKSQTALDGLK